jgi:cytochrome c553
MRPLLSVLAAVAACTPSYADDPPSKRFEHDVIARFHMHESYDLFGGIEHLLIHGKLDQARDLARGIGAAPDDTGLSAWATQSARVRDRALELSQSPSVDEGCRRAARLAAACASCHVTTDASPEFRPAPVAPADGTTVAARMAQHEWAIARVREGIVGAADEPWHAGLDVLAQAPLPWPDAAADRAAFARKLHDIAGRARARAGSDDWSERAVSYGELLVTCAACHAVIDPH